MSLAHQIVINIPFESAKQAEIARNTLLPDPILKPTEISTEYAVNGNALVCTFRGVSDRVIRIAVSSVIENIKTIIECMDEFEGKEDVVFEQA